MLNFNGVILGEYSYKCKLFSILRLGFNVKSAVDFFNEFWREKRVKRKTVVCGTTVFLMTL